MSSTIRLRLAYQAFAPRTSLLASRPLTLSRSGLSATARPGCAQSLSMTSFRGEKGNRFANPEQYESWEDEVSPFKKQRQKDFKEVEASEEDPHWPKPYPRLKTAEAERKSVSQFLGDFHKNLPETEVTLYGRIRSKRVAGKGLIFVDIVNEFQKAQVMINKKKIFASNEKEARKFAMFSGLIQVGDHISVTGIPTKTKTGEPTLNAVSLPELLSPAMEQIPEKLTDPKAKMEERHVDMLVNKETTDILRLRSEIMRFMRDHLHSKRFLEFQTPILAENAGGAVARPFVTHGVGFPKKDLSLRIAPELWLKRLVVGGIDKVFEIGPCFRNEGIDATHNPEFTMCEFYSAYTNLGDLIKETEEIMHGLARRTQELISTELTSLPPIDMSRFVRPFKQVEFVPELEAALGIRLPKLTGDDALPELVAVLKLGGIHIPGEVPTSLAKLLDRLAAMYLEPMSFEQPIFITNHPACMSPLAKSFLCPKTYQLVSARAEMFYGGRELANMYEEENNPTEQKRKLDAHRRLVNTEDGAVVVEETRVSEAELEPATVEDLHQRELDSIQTLLEGEEEKDEDAAPLDDNFLKVLDHGLPPTGGWGCGVERLVMLFSGANRIGDTLSFGTLKNVVGLSTDKPSKKVRREDESESSGDKVSTHGLDQTQS